MTQLLARSIILHRYLRGFSLTLAGSIAGQGASFLGLAITAKLLGAESFGQFGAVQGALVAAFAAGTVGLGITATRYVTKYRTADCCKLGRILGLARATSVVSGSVFTLVLLLAADPVATRILKAPGLGTLIRTSSPYCGLMTLNAYQSGVLLGFEAYGRLAKVQLVQGLSVLFSLVVLTKFWGLPGAVLSLPIGAALTCIFSSIQVRATCREFRVRVTTEHCLAERYIFSGFAIPATLSSWVGTSAIWLVQALLVRSSAGIVGMGLWTVANTMRSVTLFAPGVMNRISGPILSSLRDDGDLRRYRRALWLSTLTNTGATLAAGSALVLLQSPLLAFLGREFARVRVVIPAMLVAAAIEAYAGSIYQAIFVDGRMRYQLYINLAWAATLLASGMLMVPHGGPRGLATTYIVAWLVSAICYTGVALRLGRQAVPTSNHYIKSSNTSEAAPC